MDYEKKYKEAFKVAESVHLFSSNPAEIKRMEDIFPELAESEDEKIRKEILEYFSQFENGELRGVDITPWIAWLEKQGEQKPVEENKGNLGGTSLNWSEEDEQMLNHIISILSGLTNLHNWLKSLKDRIQPQQKQEWSDYDNKCLATIISEFSKCAGKSISKDEWMRCNDWLNSLRPQPKEECNEKINQVKTKISLCKGFNRKNRDEIFALLDSIRPQKQWKPSDIQISILEYIADRIPYKEEESIFREILSHVKEL